MDGTKFRCICLLLSSPLWMQSSVSLSTKTQFTLLTSPMTWNEAQQACHNMGQNLAKIDTELQQVYIDKYIAGDWKTSLSGDLWIGLHEIDTAQPGRVQWADCTDVSWHKFANGEPNSVSDDEMCFAMTTVPSWTSYPCYTRLQAICESTTGDCTFDIYPQHGCGHAVSASAELNWDACLSDCLTDKLPSGEECWGVGHWDGYSGNDCWKFYSLNDPDICVNAKYSNPSINVGVKVCYQSEINSSLATLAQNTYPDTTCFVIHTTTAELTTTVDQTTTSTTTIPTTTTTITTTTTMPETTSTSHTTIDNQDTTTGTMFPTLATCGCVCSMLNVSSIDLQEEIKKLKVLLTVNKTSTSLYKRKFISVKDDRVSSISIGYIGVTLLVLTFGIIIALDFPVLVIHIKGLICCNSRHRISSA